MENHSSTVVRASWQCHLKYETINNRCLSIGSSSTHMVVYTHCKWISQAIHSRHCSWNLHPFPQCKFLLLVSKPILSLMGRNTEDKQFLWHQSGKDNYQVLPPISNKFSFKSVPRLTLWSSPHKGIILKRNNGDSFPKPLSPPKKSPIKWFFETI